jgi:hypothetical protein
MIARLIQPHMQQRLGTTVIIENRSGGGGSIGIAAVAKSSPDGSTWAMVFDNHAANPFVFPNLPFDTEKDLDPVQLIGTAPYVLSTNPQKPFKTLVVERIVAHQDGIGPLAHYRSKGGLEITDSADFDWNQHHARCRSRYLRFLEGSHVGGVIGIGEIDHALHVGDHLAQDLKPFGAEVGTQHSVAGDVSARPGEACHEARTHWIADTDHDNGDRRRRFLGRIRRRRAIRFSELNAD